MAALDELAEVYDFSKYHHIFDASNSDELVICHNLDGTVRSRVYDLEWDFRGLIDSGLNAKKVVSFKNIDIKFRRDIQFSLYLILKRVKKRVGVGTILTLRNCLFRICKYIGSSKWGKLDDERCFTQLKESFRKHNLGQDTVYHTLLVVNSLFYAELCGRFIDKPNVLAKKLYCKKQRKKQHIALPEAMMTTLLKEALDYIDFYYDKRFKINQANAHYRNELEKYLKVNPPGNFPRWSKNNGIDIDWGYINDRQQHKASELQGDKRKKAPLIGSIQVACLIVVCAFTGARIGEVLSFRPDDYHEIEFDDMIVSILGGYNTKNQEAGLRSKECYPTVPIVKKALELAYDVTQFLRISYLENLNFVEDKAQKAVLKAEAESTFISTSIGVDLKSYLLGDTFNKIRKFANRVGLKASESDVADFNLLNPTRKGELVLGSPLISLSAHSLRRTFAVFLVRNRLTDLLTLRYAYKHRNLAMTSWYTNNADLAAQYDLVMDKELLSLVQTTNEELLADELFYIFNEAETLSGGEGERILGERNAYQGTVYMSMEQIKDQLKTGKLSLVEHPYGHCTERSCMRICSIAECDNKIVTREKALEQAKVRDRLISKFQSLNTGVVYGHLILQKIAVEIESIEKTLTAHKLSFATFNEKIKAA